MHIFKLPLCALCALALSVFSVGSAFAADPKPNVLYILADDLGYADVGFNGAKEIKTPNLDKLAAGGAILTSFYVQPVCSPTRSSLLTGRYVAHTGVYQVVRPNAQWGLPLNERMLPQALREAGYETALTGKWHLGEFQPGYLPTKRGFDHQYGLWFGAADHFTHMRDGQYDWHRDDQPAKEEGYSTELIAAEACKLIAEKKADKPLFLYLPFQAVHAPHQVPERYMEPYTALKGERKKYAGMVAAMDEVVGKVIEALEAKGIRDNTLIIFSSDNGGPAPGRVTDNTPLRAGKATIFEGGVRVCAFVNWPGKIEAGIKINEPLHVVDWYPTLLKLCGASTEQKLPVDGLDIWPVLTQKAKSPHDALLLSGMKPEVHALRMGDWKLLVNASAVGVEDEDGVAKTPAEKRAERQKMDGSMLLFNLADDIGEKKNLAAEKPELVKTMREKLDALMKDAVPPGNQKAK